MSYSHRNLASSSLCVKMVKITGSCHPPIEVVGGDPGMGNFQSEGFLYRPRAACCPLQLQEPSVCLTSENTGWESGLEIKWATGTGNELSGARYDCSRMGQPSFAGLSQRKFKHGRGKSGKVIFKVPFSLRGFRQLGERQHRVSLPAHSQTSECHPRMPPLPPSF